MLLLHPTLLLPVLIGCSLASFISPHYVSSYNGYYPVGPITDPEGSGTGSSDDTGANGGYAISPSPGTIFKVYRITPQGKVLVTNCNVCRLCCTGRNISVEIETIPGHQNPGNPGTLDIPRLPHPGTQPNPNPLGSDNQWSYPLPSQEGYRTAPFPPVPGQQTSTPGPLPSPASPESNPPKPDSQSTSPVPPGPIPTNPIPPNPDTVSTPNNPQYPPYPNYPYYPVAPGQYVTPPPVTNPPCVPVTTTTSTTSSTTTQAPTTTTTTSTPVPCTYTPPTITTPTPTVSTATSPPPSYVTPPTPGYPAVPSSTVPPVDSYLIPESTPAIEKTTPGTEGPGGNGACCTIDLRSLQAIVSCGISVGSGATQGCCTQSCSPGSIRQRPIQINPQFFSRYFQRLESTRITCEQAVNMGLIKSTDIEGFCNQYVPWPTNLTGPPSGGETTVPSVGPTGEPGNYVIPPTQGSANLSVITSIVTIVIATVLCF